MLSPVRIFAPTRLGAGGIVQPSPAVIAETFPELSVQRTSGWYVSPILKLRSVKLVPEVETVQSFFILESELLRIRTSYWLMLLEVLTQADQKIGGVDVKEVWKFPSVTEAGAWGGCTSVKAGVLV